MSIPLLIRKKFPITERRKVTILRKTYCMQELIHNLATNTSTSPDKTSAVLQLVSDLIRKIFFIATTVDLVLETENKPGISMNYSCLN